MKMFDKIKNKHKGLSVLLTAMKDIPALYSVLQRHLLAKFSV